MGEIIEEIDSLMSRVYPWLKGMRVYKCPVCSKKTLVYDSKLGANHCFNEFCRWADKSGPAPDVIPSFLEYCLDKAPKGRPKEVIKECIAMTTHKPYQTKLYFKEK